MTAESISIEEWRDELASGGGLHQLYLKHFFNIGLNRERLIVILLFFSISIFFIIMSIIHDYELTSLTAISTLNVTAPLLFNFSVGLLGFFVAAFAIFMSLFGRILTIRLSKLRESKSKISRYKLILITFFSIFFDYALLLVSTLSFLIFNHIDIQFSFGARIWSINIWAPMVFNSIFVAFYATLSIQCMLHLRTFIWNLFETTVLYAATLPDNEVAITK